MSVNCLLQHGVLRTRHEDYFIEPVKGHDRRENEKHPHLIYKRSALKQQDDHSKHDDHDGCGVDGMYIINASSTYLAYSA